MADDSHDENDERDDSAQSPDVVNYRSAGTATARPRGGFFSIYKKGQGYWTRMGTAISAAFIALLCGDFVYTQLNAIPIGKNPNGDPTYIPRQIAAAIALFVLAAIIFFAWRAMNKPSHVDFLIATDSEMKKVNWTTRAELMGSTKVVIFFVLLISAFLFMLDVIFGYFFQLIKVLEFGPFQ